MLRSIRYGEADRVLHLYSKTRGRLNAIAKGSRRPRSRFGGRLEPFFRLDLVLYEGRGELATVTAAHTLSAHATLRESGPALGAAARACDSVLRLLDSSEANPAAYNLLCRYLALLDGDEPPSGRSPVIPEIDGAAGHATALAFRLKLALAAGFSPELELVRPVRRGGWAHRVLGGRRRGGLRGVRARRLRALRGGALVHGGGDRQPARERSGQLGTGAAPGRAGGHRDARTPCARAPARRRLSERSRRAPSCAGERRAHHQA